MFNPGYTVQYTLIILLHSIILHGFGTCDGFPFQCPHSSHWNYYYKRIESRNPSCIAPLNYTCLLNVLTNTFEDKCSGIDYSRIGSKLVFQPFFNKKTCETSRFQPFAFSTFKNTDCVFLKSLCEEEGQVTYTSNRPDKDTTCRCDYTEGYTYVTPPRHKCYCVPSEEDCSCYKPRCSVISQDYQCFNTSTIPTNVKFTCSEIKLRDDVNNHSTVIFDPIHKDEQVSSRYSTSAAIFVTIISSILLLAGVVLVVWKFKRNMHIASSNSSTTELKEYSPSMHNTQAQVIPQTLEKKQYPQNITETKEPGDVNPRVLLIGRKGAGKWTLIQRLLYQDAVDIDEENKTSFRFFKLRLKDSEWITMKDVKKSKASLTEDLKPLIDTEKSKETTSLSHADIIIDRQESEDCQCSGSENENPANYCDRIVSLHPEMDEVKTEKKTSRTSTLVDIDSKDYNKSSSTNPFADGSSVIDDDHVICELWPIEDQLEFHLVHQITSADNVALVLVIDGTEPTWFHTDFTCQLLIDWLEIISCFITSKQTPPPVTVVFTKMDWIPETDMNEYEYFKYKLKNVVPENLKHIEYSVVFMSKNHSNENIIRNTISRSIISRWKVKVNDNQDRQLIGKNIKQMFLEGVQITRITDVLKRLKEQGFELSEKELVSCFSYYHSTRLVVFFDDLSLKDKIIISPFWIIQAFKHIVNVDVDCKIEASDSWKWFRTIGKLPENLLNQMLRISGDMNFTENQAHITEVLKKFGIVTCINNQADLYVPCILPPISVSDFCKCFDLGNVYRTPWLCIEVPYLQSAIFNDTLLHFTKRYRVCEMPVKTGNNGIKYALSSNLGLFSLDEANKRQLLLYGTDDIIAVQIWNSSLDNAHSFSKLKKHILKLIAEISEQMAFRKGHEISYKCYDGNLRYNRVSEEKVKSGKSYKCYEHDTNHLTTNIVMAWCLEEVKMDKSYLITSKVLAVAESAVRVAFDKTIKPEELQNVLLSNRSTIVTLIVNGHIDERHKRKVLLKEGDMQLSKDFDIKLMNCLLRNLRGFDIRTPLKNTRENEIKINFENSSSLHCFKTDMEKYLSIVNFYRVLLPKLRLANLSDTICEQYYNHLLEAIIGLGGEEFSEKVIEARNSVTGVL